MHAKPVFDGYRGISGYSGTRRRESLEFAIGKVAPDIEGIDLGGADFKLSDYEGKVVFLDVWGAW